MDDKAVIAVSSAQAVRDPVLVFRIGAGAQVREYTAILDPVGCSPKTKSALSDGKTHRKTAPKAESQENQNAKALRKTDKKDSANSAVKPAHNGKTHTVRKGETLKQIAAAIRPKHLTLEQVADALLKANPNVSAHGRLRAGSVLPSHSESEQDQSGSTQKNQSGTTQTANGETQSRNCIHAV